MAGSEEQEYQDYLDYQEYQSYLNSSSAPKIKSANDLLGNPSNDLTGKIQGAGRLLAGGYSQILPFGDVITAKGASLFTDKSYDQALQEVRDYQDAFNLRGKELAKSTLGDNLASKALGYVPNIAVNAPKVLAPIGSIASKAPTAFTRILASAPEGAAIGAAYGFEGGRGQEERLQGAKTGAKFGALINPGVALVGEGLKKGASKLGEIADDIKPPTAEERTIQELGLTRADFSKANKYKRAVEAQDDPLNQAVEYAQTKGIFKDSPEPKEILKRIRQAKKGIEDDLTSSLTKADKGQKDIPNIDFDEVNKFIKDNPFDEDLLKNQLERRLATLNQKWDGTISGLNELKRGIGKGAYKNSSDSRALDKALYTDFKNAIEKGADNFGEAGLGERVKQLNLEKQKLINLEPTVRRARDKSIQSQYAAPKQSPFGKIYNAASLAELLLNKSPYLFGLKAAGDVAHSDIGRSLTSKAFSGSSKIAEALSSKGVLGTVRNSAISATSRGEKPKEKLPLKQELSKRSLLPHKLDTDINLSTDKIGNQEKAPYKKIASALENNKNFSRVIDAMGKVESANNPLAVGPKTKYGHAKGKYQVLDSTGEEYHKKLGLPGKYNPYNDKTQKLIAAAILMDYSNMFDGDINKGITSYHSGPGNVQKGTLGPEGKAYLPKIVKALASS